MQFTGLRVEHRGLFLAQWQTYRQTLLLSFSACFLLLFSMVLGVCSVVLNSSVLPVIRKGTWINAVPCSQIEQKMQWARHEMKAKFARNCLALWLQEGIPTPEGRTHKGPFFLLLFPDDISFNMLDLNWAHKRLLWWLLQPYRFKEGAYTFSAVKLSQSPGTVLSAEDSQASEWCFEY